MKARSTLIQNAAHASSDRFGFASLEPSIISVWTVSLTLPYSNGAWSHLDELEQQRALRYVFDRDRRRFMLTRSALRRILADRTNTSAAALRFSYGALGKPFLREQPQLAFNVSHSEDLALIALSDGPNAIGIDIERLRTMPDANALGRTICSPEHANAIATNANADLAFLRVWTRKEAVSKAFGLGVGSIHLPGLDVGLDGTFQTSWMGKRVVVTPLEAAPGFVASIAEVGQQAPRIEQIGAAETPLQNIWSESHDG